MDKRIWLFFFLFISLMIALSNTSARPVYSSIETQRANKTEYHPDQQWGFQSTWKERNATGDELASEIINVSFETDLSGTTTNYTISDTNGVKNNTAGVYWINFTMGTNITGTSGSFTYRWYASNLTADWGPNYTNATGSYVYNISLNTSVWVRMNITAYARGGTESNTTDASVQSIQGQGSPYVDSWLHWTNGTAFTDNIGLSAGTTACFRDGASWTKGSSGATSLGVASYTVKCNSTGNANYTNNATGASYTLTVLAAGSGGGSYAIYDGETTTVTTPWQWTPPENGWELPELDQNTVIILVIIGIVILATRKKK